MTEMPSWSEIEDFIGERLQPWQKAFVASMLSGPKSQPVSFDIARHSRGWGKHLVDQWAMYSAHHFGVHMHFYSRADGGICVGRWPNCPNTTAYIPAEMKP